MGTQLISNVNNVPITIFSSFLSASLYSWLIVLLSDFSVGMFFPIHRYLSEHSIGETLKIDRTCFLSSWNFLLKKTSIESFDILTLTTTVLAVTSIMIVQLFLVFIIILFFAPPTIQSFLVLSTIFSCVSDLFLAIVNLCCCWNVSHTQNASINVFPKSAYLSTKMFFYSNWRKHIKHTHICVD